MSGQIHAPATLSAGKNSRFLFHRRRVGTWAEMDTSENRKFYCLCRESKGNSKYTCCETIRRVVWKTESLRLFMIPRRSVRPQPSHYADYAIPATLPPPSKNLKHEKPPHFSCSAQRLWRQHIWPSLERTVIRHRHVDRSKSALLKDRASVCFWRTNIFALQWLKAFTLVCVTYILRACSL